MADSPHMDALPRQRQLVAQFPENELARFSLGRTLFDRSEYREARDHFAAALIRKPDWMAVHILLGKCDLELGDPAGARAAFERARDLAVAQHHEGPLAEVESLLADLQDGPSSIG